MPRDGPTGADGDQEVRSAEMVRRRWALVLATVVLVVVTGFVSLQTMHAPPLPQVTVAPEDGRSGSITARPEASGLSLAAAEPGRAVMILRQESRQASWALTTVLLALGLQAAATIGRRGPGRRRLLELSIRSQRAWWRPVPGGRAPPQALPV